MSSTDEVSKCEQKKIGWWKRLKCALCCGSPEPEPQEETPHLVDDNLNYVLAHWSKQHHINKVEHHKASEFLKVQLEQYQREVEERMHKNDLQQISCDDSTVIKSIKKKFKHHQLSDTEDKLPHELKPISTDWKTALETLGSLHPTQSMREAVEAAVEAKQASQRQGVQKSARSSTSTTSGIKEWEKAGHLTDLLIDIMREEAQMPDAAVAEELELSSQQLAELSRFNMKQFEHLIVEYTKECLFLSLPTVEELEKFANKRAYKGKKVRKWLKIKPKAIEIKTFCTKCQPRHWKMRCLNIMSFFRFGK